MSRFASPLPALLLLGMLVGPTAVPLAAPADVQDADRAAIEAALTDYVVGFYEGDSARLKGAMHPELHKLRFQSIGSGKAFPDVIGRAALAAYADSRREREAPVPEVPLETVEVLAVDGDIATARTVSPDFIDLVHLARVDGRWQIVNVLWAPRPKPAGDR